MLHAGSVAGLLHWRARVALRWVWTAHSGGECGECPALSGAEACLVSVVSGGWLGGFWGMVSGEWEAWWNRDVATGDCGECKIQNDLKFAMVSSVT